MARFDVTTIGEGQLRYSVPAGVRLETAAQLTVNVTGTELNVTALLGRLGWNTAWVSALPDTPLGHRVTRVLRLAGVNTENVLWRESGRTATYYVEFAKPPRRSQVYYDRAYTPFTQLSVDDIDWDYLLDTQLLHISGLTMPLSDCVRELLCEAVRRARSAGVKTSFDMNYRERLWPPDEAREAVLPIIEHVDLLFFGRRDAQTMFGLGDDPEEVTRYLGSVSGAQYVVVSLSADGIMGWDRETMTHVPPRKTVVLDRIGAGDAMVGGVLHGWLAGEFEKGLRCGAVTAALALSQYGDQVITTRDEVEQLLAVEDGGDIVR